jgi:hypothetical protein
MSEFHWFPPYAGRKHQNGKDSFLQQGMKLFNDFYFPIAGAGQEEGAKDFICFVLIGKWNENIIDTIQVRC